jgi:hypothetical protein
MVQHPAWPPRPDQAAGSRVVSALFAKMIDHRGPAELFHEQRDANRGDVVTEHAGMIT